MSTTMTFSLGGTLQSQLQGTDNDVYLYAFAFDGNGNLIDSTTMISDGAVGAASAFSLDLTAGNPVVKGGNVVVVLQQQAGGGLAPTSIGQILDSTAATNGNYRYDAIEFTISNTASDVADLTNIVQFGAPMELSVTYGPTGSQTTQTRGYAVSGQTMANDLIALSPAGSQTPYVWNPGSATTGLTGQRELLGLANNVVPNPLNDPSDWTNYVTAFQGLVNGGSSSPVYIANYFNGASGASGGPAALCYFQVQYDSTTNHGEGGTFWLTPIDLNISTAIGQVEYTIGITADDLKSNIYTQTGQLSVYTGVQGTLVQTFSSFTPNNAYGDVVKFFVAGFDAGFWGGSANSINPAVSGTLSFNQNWNWTGDYAYQATNQSGRGNYGYTNSFGSNAGYDQYAQYFYQHTNAYAYSYSDLISYGGGLNPQIGLWDATLNGGAGGNVSNIDVTLFNWTDTPTGYTPSQPNVQTVTQAADTLSGLEFIFDLSLSAIAAPIEGTPITFNVYAPGDPSAVNNWLSFSLSTTLYEQVYTFGGSTGAWSFSGSGSSLGSPGYFIINNVPVIDSTTSNWGWYQLVIADGTAQEKTFNLYVDANGTTVAQTMIDGGAFSQTIAGEPNQAKFAFVPGGTLTYSPTLWNSAGSAPTPAPGKTLVAPLVGTFDTDGDFGAFAGLSNLKDANVAFSWTVGNKVNGGYYVKVSVSDANNPDRIMMPLVTQSSAGGDWLTDLSAQFGNGTYTAFMEQYRLKDPGLTTPVVASSTDATFTVNLDTLTLGAADGGGALGLDRGGSATTGNWIDIRALSSTLVNGTLLAYATDAAGNLIDRADGHTGSDVTLDDALLGRFGMVKDDDGGLLFAGDHAIYLRAGQALRFAIESGDGSIQQAPAVQVSGTGAVTVTVAGNGGSLQFSAQVNNTLSADDVLAGAQRTNDQPWTYLTEGRTVEVEAAGSAANVNTVHFVRFDVNPTSGAWSVGGVAYGNTDAFRTAVQQNWDQGFAFQNGNGTFSNSQNWTVDGGSGFYAPVLVTQSGEIFVIGTANSDGREHIRVFGENTFGFEDLTVAQGSDFDYNDMVVRLSIL
jgi:hypothetical protein